MKNITAQKQYTQVIKGVSYVYIDHPYWDKAKKQNRHKREYIGKLGQDGELIPNKKYLVSQGAGNEATARATITALRSYFGATHLLNEISQVAGIEADLRACFPSTYKIWMSLAYYLVLASDSPLYRFHRWAFDHHHPLGKEISSQRISELLRDVPESAKLEFFKRQSRRRQEQGYFAYDTTSVSSYSEYIKAVRYGKNKDDDDLPQVNMALIVGEQSSMPTYYRTLPGNIGDVSTILKLMKDIDFLAIAKLKLVLDRGFYSAGNINALFKGHHKFLIGVKINNGFVSCFIAKAKEEMHDFGHYSVEHEVYHWSIMADWPYVQTDRHGKVTLEENRRIYVHVYYNGIRGEDEKARFIKALAMTEVALQNREKLTAAQTSLRDQYFTITETPKRGLKIQYNEEAITTHMNKLGYFVLLSNEINDSAEALTIYRRKDIVEKAFDNLKNRLEMKRTTVHSDQALAGKFFLQFLALMFISYIHKQMKDNNLYRNYTMQSLLDSLDVIERYDFEGQRYHCSEITQKQRDIYSLMGVSPPNTL